MDNQTILWKGKFYSTTETIFWIWSLIKGEFEIVYPDRCILTYTGVFRSGEVLIGRLYIDDSGEEGYLYFEGDEAIKITFNPIKGKVMSGSYEVIKHHDNIFDKGKFELYTCI